ncbi:MAG: AAA family ATPase [Peptococcaceae bacterium]|jgi:DNA replication protein DnaC|nr:MAG: AAA family ATPase [Peptococcaceae bacterium]
MDGCTLCQDRGLILQGDVAVPCRCALQKSIQQRLADSNLPRNLTSCTFAKFDFSYYSKNCLDPVKGISFYQSACRAYGAARDFIRAFLRDPYTDGLIFTGQVGSGKTFLACCIANALLEQKKELLFVVVPDLLDKIRSTFDGQRQGEADLTEQDITDAAREVPLLFLDDLGAHNYTEWTKNKLYSILNYRLNECLPTVITTNISLEDLEGYLGRRTTSRLFQMCRPYRLLVEVDIRLIRRQAREAG